MDTTPSLAPSTAARSQPARCDRCGSAWGCATWWWVGRVIDHRLQPATGRFAAMRRLWPDPGEVDDVGALVAAEARPAPPDRPWLLVNMVASLDGAITIDERSGGLGGPADKAMFFALRHVADVVLVGAGTARAEGYGPPSASDEVRAARRARGPGARCRAWRVVTRSLDLDPDARAVHATRTTAPIVITHEAAPADRRAALADGRRRRERRRRRGRPRRRARAPARRRAPRWSPARAARPSTAT